MAQLTGRVYSVTHWKSDIREGFHPEWWARVAAFLQEPCVVAVEGSKSPRPPSSHTLFDHVLTHGLPAETFGEYSANTSYLLWGLHCAMWHFLFNPPPVDVFVHVQNRTLLGEDMSRVWGCASNELMSPEFIGLATLGESWPETGFFAAGREFVQAYLASHRRAAIGWLHFDVEEDFLKVSESEGLTWTRLFKGTTRRRDTTTGISPYALSESEWLSLPVIAAGKHIEPHFLNKWLHKHPS